MNHTANEINEQITYGLDTIDSEETIEIKLKDFMLIYKTFEEFNRFFYQPKHYPSIEDIKVYLGDTDAGAYAMIRTIYYQVLNQYIPKEIEEKFGEGNDPFKHPEHPYYYKTKDA